MLHYKKPTALRIRMNLTILLVPLGTAAFSILLGVFDNPVLKTDAKILH